MHHATSPSLNRLAASATTHCLIGCGIGEVLGLVIADALGWDTVAAIVLAVVLAFAFGYALTMRPLLASGMTLGQATRTALVADTASITTMEIVDNAVLLLIPGAMAAGIADPFFWVTLAIALAIAWVVTLPRQPVAHRTRTRPRRRPRRARRDDAHAADEHAGH